MAKLVRAFGSQSLLLSPDDVSQDFLGILRIFFLLVVGGGTEGVWKCSVVIRMDVEDKVEEEEAVDRATALAWRMA